MTVDQINALSAILDVVVPEIFQSFMSLLPLFVILLSMYWLLGLFIYIIKTLLNIGRTPQTQSSNPF